MLCRDGMTRSESKQAMLSELGAVPVVADALDPDQVAEAVGRARPDVIVHQLTAIPARLDLRHFDRDFALTSRLRTAVADDILVQPLRALPYRQPSRRGGSARRSGGRFLLLEPRATPALLTHLVAHW
jgi:hypothetical protein